MRVTLSESNTIIRDPTGPTAATTLLREVNVGQDMSCIHVDDAIFVGIEDESSVIEVDVSTFGIRNEYRGEEQSSSEKSTVYMIVSNEKYLCFAYGNYVVQFNRADGTLVRKIKATENGSAFIMDIDVNDEYFFCCTTKGIKQWDIETGELRREISLREGVYGSITAFKHYLITMEFGERDLFLWNINTGSFIAKLRIPMEMHHIFKDIDKKVEEDGYIYLRSDNYIYMFNVELREISLAGRIPGSNVVPCFILNGQRLFSFGQTDESIIETNAENGESRIILRDRRVAFFNVSKVERGIILSAGSMDGELFVYSVGQGEYSRELYEEDQTAYDNITADSDSIQTEINPSERCTNKNVMTLEDFTEEDDPIIVYLLNSDGEFKKGVCMTREELINYYRAFIGTSLPDNIMSIYTTPKDRNATGHSGDPTGKIVVKLPTNNIYVTMGSMERIIHSVDTKEWYALSLFGGKRRRVGNLRGIFGASMNHGQVPGYIIYKIYTKEEIVGGVVVKEDKNDYPKFVMDNARALVDLLGDDSRVNDVFVESLIEMLTRQSVE